MRYVNVLRTLLVVVIALAVIASPAAAHGWQTTVTQGPMELGISSTPETPVAGMLAEYSARIADSEVEDGEENRLPWGGVVNTSVEIHINGPDGVHDHVTAEIPEDDAHFYFAYLFPTEGNYTISVVAELEGEEYAFQFTETVMLLPARATGPEMSDLTSNVDAVQEDVSAMQSELSDLRTQVDSLEQQLADHDDRVADSEAQSDVVSAQGAGFGVTAVLVAMVAIVGFVLGKRS